MAKDVCTHKIIEEEVFIPDLENPLDDAKDAAMETLREKMKEEIEALVETFILDNCG